LKQYDIYIVQFDIPQVALLFVGYLYTCSGASNIKIKNSIVEFQAINRIIGNTYIREFQVMNPDLKLQFSNYCNNC
jgi:hypothetical protein